MENFEFLQFTLLASFQDCKQFQGELFGVCNLFRDLSDKLFTSEIIELHEKQGKDDGNCSTMTNELPEIMSCFLPQKQVGATIVSKSENNRSIDDDSATTNKPVLEELGKFNCFPLYFPRSSSIITLPISLRLAAFQLHEGK